MKQRKPESHDTEELVKLALIMLLVFLVMMATSSCAHLPGKTSNKSYIKVQRKEKIACIKDFLQFDVSPADSKNICLDIFKRYGNTIKEVNQ